MDIVTFLCGRLCGPLPGIIAHRTFVPDIPDAISRLLPPPPNARASAVIVPIIIEEGAEPRIVFTVRSEGLSNHKGQISFPGGMLDKGEDPPSAGLRELNEELGIHPSAVVIIGSLSPIYIPPSNCTVTPLVGVLNQGGPWVINQAEVAEVLEVPLARFLHPDSIRHSMQKLYGKMVDVPQWDIHPTVPLWGATAMILHELVHLVNEFRSEHI